MRLSRYLTGGETAHDRDILYSQNNRHDSWDCNNGRIYFVYDMEIAQMKLKELVAVIDESEQLTVKMNISRNKKEWGKQDINLMDMEVTRIRTDGCAMIFAEVDIR